MCSLLFFYPRGLLFHKGFTWLAPFSPFLLCSPWVVICVPLVFSDRKFCEQVSHRHLNPAAVLGHFGVHGAQQPRPLPEGSAGDHHWPTHSTSSGVSKHADATPGRRGGASATIILWLNAQKKTLDLAFNETLHHAHPPWCWNGTVACLSMPILGAVLSPVPDP